MLPPRLMSLNSSEACVQKISIKTLMGTRFVMKKRIWKELEISTHCLVLLIDLHY